MKKYILFFILIVNSLNYQISFSMEEKEKPEEIGKVDDQQFFDFLQKLLQHQALGMMEEHQPPREEEEPQSLEKIDYKGKFLALNTQYYLFRFPNFDPRAQLESSKHGEFSLYDGQLPYMLKLQPTLHNIEEIVAQHDINRFRETSQLFIQQLEQCKEHVDQTEDTVFEKGRLEFLAEFKSKLAYIDSIETSLSPAQFAKNNQLIKEIKRDNRDLARKKGRRNLASVKRLLGLGASSDSKDVFTGKSALITAITDLNTDIFDLLLHHKANVNLLMDDISQSKPTHSPLSIVTEEILSSKQTSNFSQWLDLEHMLSQLLNHGAHITIPDYQGRTAQGLIPDALQRYQSNKK